MTIYGQKAFAMRREHLTVLNGVCRTICVCFRRLYRNCTVQNVLTADRCVMVVVVLK